MIDRMMAFSRRTSVALGAVAVVLACAGVAGAGSGFRNGNFETGDFTGWNWACDACNGEWVVSGATVTPLSSLSWFGPPQGDYEALADQSDPDSLVLYRSIKVGGKKARLTATVEYKNHAGAFCTPKSLDPSLACNQQLRIDVLAAGADPYSMDSGDILKSVFRTKTSSPLTLGPTKIISNLTGFSGKVVLRVAVVTTEDVFNVGIDAVNVNYG
jgi:hypothetical protein